MCIQLTILETITSLAKFLVQVSLSFISFSILIVINVIITEIEKINSSHRCEITIKIELSCQISILIAIRCAYLNIIRFKGAFGEVRLCTHRKTGAKRAVKIIKKSFLQGKEETRFL